MPSDPPLLAVRVPAKLHTHKALVAAVGLISSAFGAGAGTQLVMEKARSEVAGMIAPVKTQADEARREAFALQQEIRALRRDLSRGFGRALVPAFPGRDAAGKAALRMYENELLHGASPEQAMRAVVESDF